MEPIPVGTVVDYHGSQTHGRYIITEHKNPAELFPDDPRDLRVAYPDGVSYVIWPVGVEHKFGNRHLSVWRVRRKSLTVVEE